MVKGWRSRVITVFRGNERPGRGGGADGGGEAAGRFKDVRLV